MCQVQCNHKLLEKLPHMEVFKFTNCNIIIVVIFATPIISYSIWSMEFSSIKFYFIFRHEILTRYLVAE